MTSDQRRMRVCRPIVWRDGFPVPNGDVIWCTVRLSCHFRHKSRNEAAATPVENDVLAHYCYEAKQSVSLLFLGMRPRHDFFLRKHRRITISVGLGYGHLDISRAVIDCR